ncbi:MAG: isoleucine--tRNA ligase, partial [Chlamydiales bacterium]|nr:isoleucine--tRNA ligase [Chlamydiales bacterium]
MFNIQKEGYSEREKRIQKFWEENRIFKKSIENRNDAPLFSFYDGPPFATGLPHYGHILAGTIKDVVPRYMTMKGFKVPRRFGWDCHGLPVENEIEKSKELSGSHSIEKFGIANFNEECRSIVLRYTEEWKYTVHRMGRWVDFDHTYKTMDTSFMESVWWVFASLWKKDLIYEGFKVMPFSAQLGTPLSNFEANLNYKEVPDPSLTVKFPLKGEENTYLLVWTTTPWTLVSNLAAVANPKMTYVKILDKESKKKFILAGSRVKHYFKDREKIEVISTFHGLDLKDKEYFPPFEYFIHDASPNAFKVLVDEFVGEDDGTGIVHAAPAFGELDFFVCKREEIDIVCPVDQNGRFTKEIPEYEGMFVKDADKDIIKRLKAKNLVFHHGQIVHRYPFCWRSDQPLIYKAVNTWFVAVEKIKDHLLKANDQINWVPDHIKYGRFGKWLENARDWAISRNRYWGTPIPIWRNDEGVLIVISSKQELEQRAGKKINDLHRHFIDDITFEENGKIYKRIPEVFDCWFESGSMPYAQNHFPFENKEETLQSFPADFIAEGLDQTRGWFYTLNVLSVALFDQPAFKNVIVNGIVLAEDGNKMSKRLKNYPDPLDVVEKYGADSVRLYLLHSPVVEADDFRFSEKGVELVLRQFLIP